MCGRPPSGRHEVSLRGERTCASHGVVDRCVFCARPKGRTCAGWSRFTATTARCPTCSSCAVETQEQARLHIPEVRRTMAEVGIELAVRVRVELSDVAAVGRELCTGLTRSVEWADGRAAEVVGIEIARGLPDVHFGMTLAHEIGHAWLIQNGATDLEPTVAEGVCELFAGAWLKRRGTSLAAALREEMATNADPVYGVGYRLVRDAVITHGVAATLARVVGEGSLP
jgi:hypothetical protein